jgi:triosephosphate isomerase
LTDLRTPAVIVNFKVYSQVEGEGALRLANTCAAVAEESGVSIAVCPPMPELSLVARDASIPVFSQNVSPRKPGSGTGYTTPSAVKATGAFGTLINHSENRQPAADVGACVDMCHALGVCTCVCAESVEKAKELAAFSPKMVAVEPPELIGGYISVTTANPRIVQDTVAAVEAVDPKVAVLCGAGVKTGQDVKTAIDLGAKGVLLASGVVKAADPEAVLRDLIRYI